jgi:hypothetical protein
VVAGVTVMLDELVAEPVGATGVATGVPADRVVTVVVGEDAELEVVVPLPTAITVT